MQLNQSQELKGPGVQEKCQMELTAKQNKESQSQSVNKGSISEWLLNVNKTVNAAKGDKTNNMDQDITHGTTPQYNIQDPDQPQEPKTMDLQIVIQMFQEIKRDLTDFKSEMPVDQIKNFVAQEQSNATKIAELQGELRKQQESNRIMVGTVQRMSKIMSEMEDRLNNLEKAGFKESLVLTGFPMEFDGKDRKKQLKNFFKDTMGITANIVDSYLIGESDQRPIVITFSNIQERNDIFYNKQKLKEFSNINDKPFFINELLPPVLNEMRRKQREIFTQNKRNTASNIEMSLKRGKLQVQNQPYTDKIKEPRPEDFLSLTEVELKDIMRIKIKPGKQITENANVFTSFSSKVKTHQEIRRVYTKMKLLYPESRHIMCGYRIKNPEQYHAENACDDGEHAGGQTILNCMKQQKVRNCVVFVIRNYGGHRLGKRRFDIITEATNQAIACMDNVETDPTGLNEENQRSNQRSDTEAKTRDKRKYEPRLNEGEEAETDERQKEVDQHKVRPADPKEVKNKQ